MVDTGRKEYIIPHMSEGIGGGGPEFSFSTDRSDVEVAPERTETTDTPEVLQPELCGVNLKRLPSEVRARGFRVYDHAILSCGNSSCSLNTSPRRIDKIGEGPSAFDDARRAVRETARTTMSIECAVWTSDSANVGKEIPNERLPRSLRR